MNPAPARLGPGALVLRRRLSPTALGGVLVLAVAGCGSSRTPGAPPMTRPAPPRSGTIARPLTIDLLALDLATCGRCTGTERNLDAALATVAKRLRSEGVEVEVRKTVVKTAEEAVRLRFESSPTIRVDGRDIALDFRESECGDCADLCGCSSDVLCRVWVWEGREYLEAPEGLIVDAVLRAHREGSVPRPAPTRPFRLPENLRRFFEAKARPTASTKDACCDRTSCCDPSERKDCCGEGGGCGCRDGKGKPRR